MSTQTTLPANVADQVQAGQLECPTCHKVYAIGEWPFCPHGEPTMKMITSDGAGAANDRAIYRKHNIVQTRVRPLGDGVSAVKEEPNSPELQCQCGNCGSHRKRAGVTETADKGKDIN